MTTLPTITGELPDILAGLDVPRVPQQARSRQKRDALLAAAAHLFEERGYEATTADDIAAAADVSIGTFYSYFRNKRQVFLTLFADCVRSVQRLDIDEIDFTQAPQQAIRRALDEAMTRDELFYGMRRASFELLSHDAEIATIHMRLNEWIYAQILVAVRRVVAAGQAWPALDVESTCWLITQLFDRAWQIEPKPGAVAPATLERQRQALTDMVYHTIFRC